MEVIKQNKYQNLFEYPKNIYDSLSEQLESGKITLREAAIKLHKAGVTPFIDEEYTKKKLL